MELRFTLARKLGLSPKSLFDDRVEFVWRDTARFKHLSGEGALQQATLASFGVAIGQLLLQATPTGIGLAGIGAEQLRSAVLQQRQFVDLPGLLAISWGIGVPVIHLRVFPLRAKSMHAMVVNSGDRYAILLGRDAQYPAPLAFALAHELGHVANGHLAAGATLVEIGDPVMAAQQDSEEIDADRFALTLLTGMAEPDIRTNLDRFGARQLAAAALDAGPPRGVEPGTLALCQGFLSKNWSAAVAALRYIYIEAKPVWREINQIAVSQLRWEELSGDAVDYLRNVMGIVDE